MTATPERVSLPGFGLAVHYYQTLDDPFGDCDVPSHALFKGGWHGSCVLVRERRLCEAIDRLTDKPDWRRKVFDDTITTKWRSEVVRNEDDPVEGFSDAMFDFCLSELQDKARKHEDTGIVSIYEVGPVVCKSDSLVSEDTRLQLRQTVAELLENVPERLMDWHPGSNGKVLDLVHPSLFPLMYGRSRALPTSTICLKDCLAAIGTGELVSLPSNESGNEYDADSRRKLGDVWSHKFQWLPAEVKWSETGVTFTSYINNLHPIRNRPLYGVIEKVLSHAIPLWDEVFSRLDRDPEGGALRFPSRVADYEFFEGTGVAQWRARRQERRALGLPIDGRAEGEEVVSADQVTNPEGGNSHAPMRGIETLSAQPRGDAEEGKEDGREEDDSEEGEEEEGEDGGGVSENVNSLGKKSDEEIGEADRVDRLASTAAKFDADDTGADNDYTNKEEGEEDDEEEEEEEEEEGEEEEEFNTSEEEAFDNHEFDSDHEVDWPYRRRELIPPEPCSYEDHSRKAEQGHSPNLKESYGDQGLQVINDYSGLEKIFGIEQEEAAVQDIGKVLTRQGRLLAFPNVIQHKVSPFSLADRTKPGHRKILAFFLVHPKARIISTANVPPQRKDWWEAELQKAGSLDFMPSELQKHIIDDVDDFPIDLQEAKMAREQLMEERKTYTSCVNDVIIGGNTISFCEH
ncbi:hypothetical protein CAC42_871 [Sphaceloma murrayae]|uniref:Uncharacterized protein n=1 Tax=Sphaceloma murrayae TaxID=2082308 RepID=A0A2K1QKZ7_9PEZI|nr:hypothetical protein CAC42_871 [Sphaceloma murrayae]